MSKPKEKGDACLLPSGEKIGAMISLVIWLAILWVCFGVGAAVLARLHAPCRGPAEEVPFAIGLGMGLLSYLVLGIGLLGLLQRWVIAGIIVAMALVGWRHMLRLARETACGAVRWTGWRWGLLPLLLVLSVSFVFTTVGALAPATDSDYDSLVYHLAIPKVYLRDGAVHPVPWLTHSNFPFTMEMLYLVGLALRDQSLAKLFHFGCGWLTVLAVFAFARRWWSPLAGWLGAAIFATIPIVLWQMTTAYNELAFALYAFLTAFALAGWFEARRDHDGHAWLWVAALMCGLAMGVKILAGALFIFALAALAWTLRTPAYRPRPVKQIVVFCLLAVAVAAPWYLKSYLWTGNPVYPFMYEIFDGRYWSAERARLYTEAQQEFGSARLYAGLRGTLGVGVGPLAFAALPWDLTMRPRWFFDHPTVLREFAVYVTVFGPLLLALLPTLLVSGTLGHAGRLALLLALTYTAIWFGLTQNGRYLVPILPCLCACAGVAAERLLVRRGITSSATIVALVLACTSGLLTGLRLAAPAARVVLGTQSASEYLSANSPTYRLFSAVGRATPADAKIMVLGHEPRCFYLERDYLLGNHAEIFSTRDLASSEGLLEAFGRMGVTHLLLHPKTQEDMAGRSGALETRLAELAAARKIVLTRAIESLTLWEVADAGSKGAL